MKRISVFLAILLALSSILAFASCGREESDEDNRPLIVALGDSGAEGGGSSWVKIEDIENEDKLNDDGSYNFKRTNGSYVNIAGEIMGYRVENYATGGYITADITSQIKSNKYGCADALKEADYIYIGTFNNEFMSYFMQVTSEADQNKYTTADTVISELYLFDWPELLDTIRSINSDAPIIVNNFLSYFSYWPGSLEAMKDSTGIPQAYYRLWKNVALRYLEEHPGAYDIVDLTGRETASLSYSNGDDAHPNDRYNMKLALGTVDSFTSLGFYERDDAQEAENLKAYIPTLWDGFNRYMAHLKETQEITADVSVDIDAFNASIENMNSLSEIADAYCEMYTQKDPRPFTE